MVAGRRIVRNYRRNNNSPATRIDHSFQPTLIITNLLEKKALQAAPVLYAADGVEFQLPPVALAPAGVSSVDIRAALSAAPEEIKQHFSEFGSAAVKYMWHWPGAVSAMVQNQDAKRSLNFNFELQAQMEMKHPAMKHGASVVVRDGLWWREDNGVKGSLALVNVARRPIDVQVQVLSEYGAVEIEKRIHLQANETHKLDLLEDADGSAGGIRVTYDGSDKEVVLAGALENSHEGYSAQIPFLTIPSETKPSTIAVSSVGLMLGTPDPMMKFPSGTQFGVYLALRNTSTRPVLVSPTLYYMEAGQARNSVLKTIVLGARQSRYWSTEQVYTDLGIPRFSNMINLVFSYEGGPSDVIMANGSIDQTKNYVFEINMKAVGQSQAKTLKDWDVSHGNDTMISVLNMSEDDQDLAVTFFFDSGTYRLPLHLEAHGSTMFNVSDIIMMHSPDSSGQIIPSPATHGTAVLSGVLGYAEPINVGVSVGVFNVSTATCGNKCPNCYGYSAFQVSPVNGMVPAGNTASFKALAYGQNGTWQDVTTFSNPNNSAYVVWSTSNSQIATSQGNGQFKGVAPGNFVANATATLIDLNADCPEGSNSPCPTSLYYGDAPGTILPAPHHVSVVKDQEGYATGCPAGQTGLYVRQMLMQVVDVNGVPLTYNPSINEAYNPAQPVNSCPGGGSPSPSQCAPTGPPCVPCGVGQFLDTMTVSMCSSVINPSSGCGFTLTSTWSACASSGTNAIWTSTRVTHSNGVTVNGQASVYPPGTQLH